MYVMGPNKMAGLIKGKRYTVVVSYQELGNFALKMENLTFFKSHKVVSEQMNT